MMLSELNQRVNSLFSRIVGTNDKPMATKEEKELIKKQKKEQKEVEKKVRKIEEFKLAECNKFYQKWVEVMGYMNLGNEKSETYALRDMVYQDFGFTCKIYTPLGMNLATLQNETVIQTIQDNLACTFIANKVPKSRYMEAKFILKDIKFEKYTPIELPPYEVLLGQNIDGTCMTSNMLKYPHAIIQGSTNMGKSRFIDAMVTNLVVTNKPEDLSMYIVQADKSDQYPYAGCYHCQGYTSKHEDTLKMLFHLVEIIEKRDEQLKGYIYNGFCSNIYEYNEKIKKGKLKAKKWNYMYLIIDEYASLMPESSFGAEKEVKKAIQGVMERLIQIGRYVGLYIILSTQRATVDKLPSFIKANCCTIVSFKVNNRKSSEIALDSSEAVNLKQREFISKIEAMSFGQTYNLTAKEIVDNIKPFRELKPKKFSFSSEIADQIIEEKPKNNSGGGKRTTKSQRKTNKKIAIGEIDEIIENVEKKEQKEIKETMKNIGEPKEVDKDKIDIEEIINNTNKKKEKNKK